MRVPPPGLEAKALQRGQVCGVVPAPEHVHEVSHHRCRMLVAALWQHVRQPPYAAGGLRLLLHAGRGAALQSRLRGGAHASVAGSNTNRSDRTLLLATSSSSSPSRSLVRASNELRRPPRGNAGRATPPGRRTAGEGRGARRRPRAEAHPGGALAGLLRRGVGHLAPFAWLGPHEYRHLCPCSAGVQQPPTSPNTNSLPSWI
mmetsp:Transcript_17875/g.45455  ORF Transcript_17875/g.45455 Transcript_17875/m.45455 type:complete len:202 (-) Transcript_17875:236-841(-)